MFNLTFGWSNLILSRLFSFTAHKKNKLNLAQQERQVTKKNNTVGQVFLVGSGPGDAELLTLKAYRLLQSADVVMYDWLVSPDIVNMIPKHVEKVFVGKKCGRHSMTQDEICQLLSRRALAGQDVVRLKGGDPSIFGRAAEEVEHLQQHNIDFAIVPGVTAASGCAAWSGIPLTHRDCAHSVRFITAHFKSDDIESDWKNYAESSDTLVFYMGLNKVKHIAESLISYGKNATTPMAIIDQGTTNAQKTYISDLANIEQVLNSENIVGPALIVVGDVINYQAQVNIELLTTDLTNKKSKRAVA
ncbi:uroporphyrinogen-III C-methyltransferase [Psychrosphaera aquimarina]|uniref:uroporphyrinogen-III C-methyltransferase n=1 Tax=Psychrosphaera aquimarina TaxID=2044854 RepID=A0ABU3QYC1_9GAMM|nr:uroporphyrinogen-III C-methyltransferase [Psychrosphaera aquimarina]MDU0112426.1 uroporphyrinogen-III C-methyltransferase [Psychrosphaera aquimarina]